MIPLDLEKNVFRAVIVACIISAFIGYCVISGIIWFFNNTKIIIG